MWSAAGQVLVQHDLLGLAANSQPRFVKRYAELGRDAAAAIAAYADEVRRGVFPATTHTYGGARSRAGRHTRGEGGYPGPTDEEGEA